MLDRLARWAVIGVLLVSAPFLFARLYRYRWYSGCLLDWVARLNLQPDSRVLEVGCGPGNLSAALSQQGYQVTGVDRSEAMIKAAQRHDSSAEFQVADAMDLPFAAGRFEAVIAGSLLNVVPDRAGMVRELARVAANGAVVSVFFPTPDFTVQAGQDIGKKEKSGIFERAALSVWAGKARKLDVAEVVELFEKAGLEQIDSQHYLGGVLASVSGKNKRQPDPRQSDAHRQAARTD